MIRQQKYALAFAAFFLFAASVAAQTSQKPKDLTDMSLEDLLNVQVTSVSKKEQKLSRVAAAVFVITQEDIRRSGATNVPDVLRMAPGVEVAQLDANIWVITIRGFADRFADKVLVLIDGRSVYTPTSSGVYWDQQDVPLEDIERIEVIRGPGGTVWGANAVNGVINIITKKAGNTLGGLVTATAGSRENIAGVAQYGGEIGKRGAYRVFGKYSNTGSFDAAPDAPPAADGWHLSHGGFRSDWDLSARDTLTFQGDLLSTSEGETINVTLVNPAPFQTTFNSRTTVGAGNLLGRWTRKFSDHSEISIQSYYDSYNRNEEGGFEGRKTFDFDLQHRFALGSRQDIVWGFGYRVTTDDLTPKFSKSFVPQRQTDNLFSGFLQDEIALTKSLSLTAGTKVEHNAYTGVEYEPGAQLLWTPTARQGIWVSVARAIRQPARADAGIRIALAPVTADDGSIGLLEAIGNPDRKAETLVSYQLGYRNQFSKRLSLDLATFSNYYHRLQTAEPGTPFPNPAPGSSFTVFPLIASDQAHAHTYGAEVFTNFDVTKYWRLSSGYSYLRMRVVPDASSQDTSVTGIAGDTPRYKFEVRSQVNLRANLDWDSALYHVSSLPDMQIPGYYRLDTRIAWRVGGSLELSVVGQNLLHASHSEFGDDTPLHTQPRRNVFGKITWHF